MSCESRADKARAATARLNPPAPGVDDTQRASGVRGAPLWARTYEVWSVALIRLAVPISIRGLIVNAPSLMPLCKLAAVVLMLAVTTASASSSSVSTASRMFEKTFESRKQYADPFNDVDVDVIFSKDGQSWRVPAFWRGGQKWTVRFAPAVPGEYAYRYESTDRSNADLNGQEGRITIAAYDGSNSLLKHGMLQVSANKHHFEFADGTPFYWLGDTWWTGLSDRLSWEGFKQLTADRKAKGFTVVQIVAGLIPPLEFAPVDPGYRNEGGAVWDPKFQQINPRYFDYADRRIQHLVDEGLTPAIVGAWAPILRQTGIPAMKKHWRYIIARYGAFPVFWIAGGEVYDPPQTLAENLKGFAALARVPGWNEVVKYIRETDPYRHPVSVHDMVQVPSLENEGLTDYYLFQCGHSNWRSIPTALERLHQYYSNGEFTKPIVIGEIGYEKLGGTNLEDFQRAVFWLVMLNGAAGHTYGANGTWAVYTPDKSLHRMQWSFMTWQEGMNFPGSYQLGIGARLLQQYPWWQFQPHREWVTPRGDVFKGGHAPSFDPALGTSVTERGNFFLPYAAGIPEKVRFIYMPYFDFMYSVAAPPTVLGLEIGVRYKAFFWDPTLGIKFDLGTVERPSPGKAIREDDFTSSKSRLWVDHRGQSLRQSGKLSANSDLLTVIKGISEKNLVAAVDVLSDADAGLVLRYEDEDNFLSAMYSAKDKEIYLVVRKAGADGPKLAQTAVADIGDTIRLSAEVRETMATLSVSDGQRTYTAPIVDVSKGVWYGPPDNNSVRNGSVGLIHRSSEAQSFDNFEVRNSPILSIDEQRDRKLYDAKGDYRGEMIGEPFSLYNGLAEIPGWGDFGRDKHILLDAYRPQKYPFGQDWVLILDAQN